jgi:hypothetical protein
MAAVFAVFLFVFAVSASAQDDLEPPALFIDADANVARAAADWQAPLDTAAFGATIRRVAGKLIGSASLRTFAQSMAPLGVGA